ncbi:uncharacterized protein C1orf109 homolog isoform X1 [Ornithorhynchus anatinus]|nr:uncharacterized protein C1orf109 homolog isoform X1 [Ornithorhynchus anatinus]XP_028936174.1 uncharacterized protein C1orf109 homolog isoform X1 [Ornithorhynchus anatinus]
MAAPGPRLTRVREVLKACFRAVERQQNVWRSALQDCRPLLGSLGNLAEQVEAAQNVAFEAAPLGAFPDLRERLKRKQLTAGDTILDKLEERMAVLLGVRDAVSGHVERAFEVYEQHARPADIDAILLRSAVIPSIADMLEWLQDIERSYRNLYLGKRDLINQISWDNLPFLQALPQAWERVSEDDHQDLVHDTLLMVSFFLDS